jgi:signal transduction histidine kinase
MAGGLDSSSIEVIGVRGGAAQRPGWAEAATLPAEASAARASALLGLRERELDAVEAIGDVITELLSPDQIDLLLDVVVARAKALLCADLATLDLADESGCQTVRGSSGIRTEAIRHLRIPIGVGVNGVVVQTGRPKRVADYGCDASITHELNDVVGAEGIRALMSVPFFLDSRVAGTLNVARRSPDPFSPDDEQLLVRLARQATVALKIATLWQEVRALEAERAHLLHDRLIAITRAKELERKRIARELHDDLGQTLSALVVNLEASRREPDLAPQVRSSLESCVGAARDALRSVRTWLGALRIPLLETIDLARALGDELLPNFEAETGCQAYLEVQAWPEELPGEVTFNVYRVVQEALTNVRRHARARSVHVRLATAGDQLLVSIADDGVGIGDEPPLGDQLADKAGVGPSQPANFGLIGMRERATLLGGQLRVVSAQDGGTTVILTIPSDWTR